MRSDLVEMAPFCEVWAKFHGVNASMHSEDMILRFLLGNSCFPSKADAIKYYFQTGKDSASNLLSILKEAGVSSHPVSLLEFASGYGCLSRHLITLPDLIDLTSCDIHTEAISFLSQEVGVKRVILSEHKPESFACEGMFDVVFALSFFSHMPRQTWGDWLVALYGKVRPGGHLLFTTQGLESAKYFGNPTVPSDGFWFKATSEQKDLEASEYGQTICTYDFVSSEVSKRLKAQMVMYKAGYWWAHQDVYMVARPVL